MYVQKYDARYFSSVYDTFWRNLFQISFFVHLFARLIDETIVQLNILHELRSTEDCQVETVIEGERIRTEIITYFKRTKVMRLNLREKGALFIWTTGLQHIKYMTASSGFLMCFANQQVTTTNSVWYILTYLSTVIPKLT